MKGCLSFVLLAAAVCAEPPRYRGARFQLQRQELPPGAENSDREATTPKAVEAPYAASGWRPAKEFKLPSRQEAGPPATSYGTPDASYGAPLTSYSAPQNEYGVPTESATESTTPSAEEATTASSEIENLKVEGLKRGEQSEKQSAGAEVQSYQGAYYVLLPNSQLQRVDFRTENDLRNMAYTARLQYRNENQGPIYVYTPQQASYTAAAATYTAYGAPAPAPATAPLQQTAAYIQYV